MQQGKVKVELSGVPASMLVCLWNRAQLSKKYRQLFNDEKAIELVEKIDYDFSTIQSGIPFEDILSNISLGSGLPLLSLFNLRAKQFDNKVKAYIGEHPRASIVNIGAGLDTTFYRVDNGLIHWYDLDLTAVIDIRRQLLPEPDRVTYIAKSLLDPSWFEDVNIENGVFIIAGGVFGWFEETQVKQFFSMLADNFPGGEIVFNFRPRSDESADAWIAQFPPEQQSAVRAAWVEALKDWWEKAPQSQKDELNDMLVTLKISTKPRGKEWADIEAWLNLLEDKDKDGIIANSFFRGGIGRWALEDASEFTKWDSRITVIDQFPLFKNIPRDPLSADARRVMDYSDEGGKSSIIHLRV